jgi:hypothetical protein
MAELARGGPSPTSCSSRTYPGGALDLRSTGRNAESRYQPLRAAATDRRPPNAWRRASLRSPEAPCAAVPAIPAVAPRSARFEVALERTRNRDRWKRSRRLRDKRLHHDPSSAGGYPGTTRESGGSRLGRPARACRVAVTRKRRHPCRCRAVPQGNHVACGRSEGGREPARENVSELALTCPRSRGLTDRVRALPPEIDMLNRGSCSR